MNVALPVLDDRVSPVFDVAQTVWLVEFDGHRELRRETFALYAREIARRVAELSQRDVNVLICGAISRPLEAALWAAGICVIPQTCGAVEAVLHAFAEGRLTERAFVMPGCCGGRRRRQRGRVGGRRFRCAPRQPSARRPPEPGTG